MSENTKNRFGTLPVYGTFTEELLRSPAARTDEDVRMDQALLGVHLDRLGYGTVLQIGVNNAILNRHVVKLDPADYTKVPFARDGHLWIPAAFAARYFGTAAEENGYTDLTALCAAENIPLTYDLATGFIAVTPASVCPFNLHADTACIARLLRVFHEPLLPEPIYNDAEQTRQVIASSAFPAGDTDWGEKAYYNLYSPTLLITRENGKKVLYISHEYSHTKKTTELSADTVLLRSTDGGAHFSEVGRVENMRWAHLFTAGGHVHLIGNRIVGGQAIRISRLETDDTFSTVTFENPAITVYPNNHLCVGGRVYMPTCPQLLSAPENADLLKESSWTFSDSVAELLPVSWYTRASGHPQPKYYGILEPTLTVTPAGELFILYRIEMQPYNGLAAIVRLSADGRTITPYAPTDSLVKLPTAVSKFCVRYDAATQLYLAMPSHPSLPTPRGRDWPPLAGQRNILSLVASPDLIHWKTLDILLTEREVINPVYSALSHAYQYVVWDFDGEDLLFVVRETTGYAQYYHDGKYVALYRLHDYKKLVKERFAAAPFFEGGNVQ